MRDTFFLALNCAGKNNLGEGRRDSVFVIKVHSLSQSWRRGKNCGAWKQMEMEDKQSDSFLVKIWCQNVSAVWD